MSTVCWNGIVKNESRIIERCMRSLVDHIDYWVVIDTGSEDGTQDIIRDFMRTHGVEGELIQRPWVNFSYNRSEAIQLAEGKADYLLLCDADMALEVINPDWKDSLKEPGYLINQRSGLDTVYRNTRLVSARARGGHRVRYWGYTHEYLECIGRCTLQTENLDDIVMLDFGDGGSKTDKFERDEKLLLSQLDDLKALDTATKKELKVAHKSGLLNHRSRLFARSLFYLGKTYFDLARYQEAFEMFERRVSAGGWDEEVWFSKYSMGLCAVELDHPVDTVTDLLLDAHEFRPTRAEALYELAKYLRIKEQYQKAYHFAKAAVEIPLPNDLLFIHKGVYTWIASDELSISAYWTGRYEGCANLCEALLVNPKLFSEEVHQRISANLDFALEKLDQQKVG